jgi:hypothetical protein
MKKIFLILFASLLVVSACDKVEFTKEDPNNFADSPAELMVNQPMLANALVIEGELARTGCIWSGQFTGADRQYLSLNRYITTAGDYDNIWGTLYADGITQSRILQKKAIDEKNEILEGIAMIVEANLAIEAAALWGDVPFEQVGDVENYPQPKYDAQIDVYTALLALLDKAITKVGAATGASPGYGSETLGAATRATLVWADVANSLKARIYLHLGDYSNAITSAANGISTANGDWFFEHNGERYPNNIGGSQNIYWDFCVWNRDGYMNAADAYLVPLMDGRNDARLYHYYVPPGWWSGNWDPHHWDMSRYGFPATPIFGAGEDFPVITYYETQLIIAESELLANTDAASALTALNNVRAYWDNRMGAGSFPPYTAADFATNADLLMEILTEKYISCYGQIEAFNDIRRTDNYIGVPIKDGATATKIPERFLYPQSELNSNSNVPTIQDIFVPTEVNKGVYPGI